MLLVSINPHHSLSLSHAHTHITRTHTRISHTHMCARSYRSDCRLLFSPSLCAVTILEYKPHMSCRISISVCYYSRCIYLSTTLLVRFSQSASTVLFSNLICDLMLTICLQILAVVSSVQDLATNQNPTNRKARMSWTNHRRASRKMRANGERMMNDDNECTISYAACVCAAFCGAMRVSG